MSDKQIRILEREAATGNPEAKERLRKIHARSSGIIQRVQIDWHPGYANRPTLQVLVNKIPDSRDYVYEKRGPMYFGLVNGIAQFKFYNGPGRGYGGSTFNLKMKDGSTESLKGPWSSNAAAMTEVGFPATTEVSLTENPHVMERGHTFYGGYSVTVEALAAACKAQGLRFYKVEQYGRERYEPGQVGGIIHVKQGYGRLARDVGTDENGLKPATKNNPITILERLA